MTNEENNSGKPLLELIEEGFKLMKAYINGDSKCEIIADGQPVSQHIHGPPSYDMVLQTYENTDVLLGQLGPICPLKLPRLVAEYNDLIKLCEQKREQK